MPGNVVQGMAESYSNKLQDNPGGQAGKPVPKTAAERKRLQREREKQRLANERPETSDKPQRKSGAERQKEYRARKKAKEDGQKWLVSEVARPPPKTGAERQRSYVARKEARAAMDGKEGQTGASGAGWSVEEVHAMPAAQSSGGRHGGADGEEDMGVDGKDVGNAARAEAGMPADEDSLSYGKARSGGSGTGRNKQRAAAVDQAGVSAANMGSKIPISSPGASGKGPRPTSSKRAREELPDAPEELSDAPGGIYDDEESNEGWADGKKAKPPAKTALERKRLQRERERERAGKQSVVVKAPPKTDAEKSRDYRARKKAKSKLLLLLSACGEDE
jgi:hypothetical protein